MANDEHLQRADGGGPAPALLGRLRAVLGKDAARLPDPFDARDPLHVDAAARPLLRRFYERGDSRCFDLLVELTLDAIAPAAHDVVRDVGLPLSDDKMLGILFGALFCDTRPAQVDVRHFIAFAERKLRTLAEARVKWIAARPIPHLERLPSGLPAPHAPYPGAPLEEDPPEQPVLLDQLVPSGAPAVAASIDFDRLGFDFTWLVETLFHRLPQDDRVVLRAAEIEGKSSAQLAERSEMDVSAATARLDAARTSLSRSIEAVCERLAGKARRAGCTLAGKRPEDITAEDVARHLVSCDACIQALDSVTGAQKQALVVLGSPRDPSASRVGTLIADAQAKGKETLANFLYELARACIDQIGDMRARMEHAIQPDRPESLLAGVEILSERATESQGSQRPTTAGDFASLARITVASLERVEGRTARVLLRKAYCEIAVGNWASARTVLNEAVSAAEGTAFAVTCRHALLTTLSELGEHDTVVDMSRQMLAAGVSPKAAWFCLWRSLAFRGESTESWQAARQFRVTPAAPGAARAWAYQVREAAAEVALHLSCNPQDIHAALGLADLEMDQ